MNELLLTLNNKATPTVGSWEKVNNTVGELYYPGVALLGEDLLMIGGFATNTWAGKFRKLNTNTHVVNEYSRPEVDAYPIAWFHDDNTLGFYSAYNRNMRCTWSKVTNSAPIAHGTINNYGRNRNAINFYMDGIETLDNLRTFFLGGAYYSHVFMLHHKNNTYSVMHTGLRYHGGSALACTVGEYIYLFGGNNASNKFATRYHPRLNAVQNLADMPVSKYSGACVAMDSDTIHLIGGAIDGGKVDADTYTTIYEYKISTNSWRKLPEKFPVPVHASGYTQNKKHAFIVGSSMVKTECPIYKLTF